jgi:hypothetical protein
MNSINLDSWNMTSNDGRLGRFGREGRADGTLTDVEFQIRASLVVLKIVRLGIIVVLMYVKRLAVKA